MLTGTIDLKCFKNEQVKVYSFLELVNLELKLAVFNFSLIFSITCS